MKIFKILAAAAVILILCFYTGCYVETERDGGHINELVFYNPYGLPETPHGGNILHAWNMSFNLIREHLPYIARAGFGVIQTSPIGESLNVGAMGRRWYSLYQPTAFRIGNWLGTEEEFRALTREAAAYGIYVIVDAIPNHTTSYWTLIDEALREHEPSLFHARRGDVLAENPWAQSMDFSYRRSFVRARLLGLWDFYTSRPEFQEIYMDFLGEKIDAGASGFRFDAAHHIELPIDAPDIASDFWPNITSFVNERTAELDRTAFMYGETLGGGYRANIYLYALYDHARFLVNPYAFSRHIMSTVSRGVLTDGQQGWNSTNFHVTGNFPAHSGVHGPPIPELDLGGFEGFAEGMVPWVESHDQYGNAGVSRHLSDEQILAGWALIAARQGTSPLFFVRPGQGFVNSGDMFTDAGENAWGHSLFYRDPAVAAVNWFANDFIDYPEVTSTHGNVAIIQRGPASGKTGAVLVNVGDMPADAAFPVRMVDGDYTCEISGAVYRVEEGLLAGPQIPAGGVLVLRQGAESPLDKLFVFAYPGPSQHANPLIFTGPEGIEISVFALNAVESEFYVTLDGELVLPRTAFFHGERVTIGVGAEVGDVFALTVRGEGRTEDNRRTFYFKRGEEAEPYRILIEYVRPAEGAWEQGVNIWAWNPADIFPEGWPGRPMTRDGDAWVFYFEPGIAVPITLMFNNQGPGGAGGQQTDYATVYGSSRIYQLTGNNIGNVAPIP